MRLLLIITIFSGFLNCSEPFESREAVVITVPQIDSLDMPEQKSFGSSTTNTPPSEEESLYEIALDSCCSKKTKYRSAVVAMHTKRLILERSRCRDESDTSPIKALRKKRDFGEEVESAAQVRVQELLLEAAQEAIEEMENELTKREASLLLREKQLAKKMSKRVGALITTGVGAASTIVSAVAVYLLK